MTVGFLAKSLNLGTRASPPELSGLSETRRGSQKLQLLHRYRDFALFKPAIDSKLRGCDLSLRITDVAPLGYAADGPLKSEAEQTCSAFKPISI